MRGGKGQFQMSYGMIFSIILIVVFIATAFFAIRAFLQISETITEGQLIRDLNNEVDRIWKSSQGEQNFKFERKIDPKIEFVCFYDSEASISGGFSEIGKELKRVRILGNNLYFYPTKESQTESFAIDHINMEAFDMNPYCINTEEGFIEIRLSKGLGETLVRVR